MTNRVTLSVVERFAFAGGYEFGTVGAYERLVGRAHFAVDPAGAAQRGITDLDKAPTDGDGLAHFTGDFSILKPADPARGNCRLFFDYGNRGNKRMLQFFNDAPASNDPRTLAQAGNGFLMRRGYTVAWLAWQGDLLPGNGRLLLDLPVARERHGPVTELVRTEYIADRSSIIVFPLSGRVSVRSHPTVSLDPREARLTRRRYPYDEREAVPPENWCFARVEGGTGLDNQGAVQAVVPSDSHIYIPGGFEPGWIYELVYTARDPLVLGLGHVVVRDFVSFLRYGKEDAAGRLNPLCERDRTIEKAYAWGRSQTGRCLRDFVYRGFNADTAGRKVFDGILPHVAGAGRMWLNHGIVKEPPDIVAGSDYTILVPAVDADGNDRAGVRAPMVAAPLGTYCGWNLRARGFGHGAMHEFSASYIPLPETPEERRATDDPRRSILERYQDAEAYVRAITAAARRLVEQGLMLEEDVERAAEVAADWGRPRHDIGLG